MFASGRVVINTDKERVTDALDVVLLVLAIDRWVLDAQVDAMRILSKSSLRTDIIAARLGWVEPRISGEPSYPSRVESLSYANGSAVLDLTSLKLSSDYPSSLDLPGPPALASFWLAREADCMPLVALGSCTLTSCQNFQSHSHGRGKETSCPWPISISRCRDPQPHLHIYPPMCGCSPASVQLTRTLWWGRCSKPA